MNWIGHILAMMPMALCGLSGGRQLDGNMDVVDAGLLDDES
jgi:hypothetical protein